MSRRPSARALLAPTAPPVGGSWTTGTASPASALNNLLLLTDGSVIAQDACTSNWYRLVPDSSGNYATGTWSQIASLPANDQPLYFGSAVLPDGRVMMAGGEYNNAVNACSTGKGTWTNLGAIYDPTTNLWTAVAPPSGWNNIGDGEAIVLANGTYMQADCCFTAFQGGHTPMAALLNATSLTWTATGSGKADEYDEEGWTLLPNGTVLTVDVGIDPTGAATCSGSANGWETYNAGTGSWTAGSPAIPLQLADCTNPGGNFSFELGPQVLRADGTVVAFAGSTCNDGTAKGSDTNCANMAPGFVVTSHTAIYDSTAGTWAAGPDIPAVAGENYTIADGPAALEPSGTILFAASPNYVTYANPTHFFEYLPGTPNTIRQVSDPPAAELAGTSSFYWNFLVLPNGQIMATDQYSTPYFYTPTGTPQAGWAPTISSVPANLVAGATYPLSGTQLNGLSQGAAYGDDAQNATNYPLVRITNTGTGHVFYGRTFGHSTMSVAPGTAGSTNFTVPANIDPGVSTLAVVANGIASTPVNIAAARPVYAKQPDFNGDGTGDLLWRFLDGTIAIWEMSNGQPSATPIVGVVPTNWQIAGTGDFAGTGDTGLLWRDTAGDVAIWLLNGGSVVSSVGLGQVTTDWTIVGVGNFFGGSQAAILWRYKDGTLAAWQMNGTSVVQTPIVGFADTTWQVVGVGDFFNTGTSAILWRNTSGALAIWRLGNGQVTGSFGLGTVTTDWTVVGTGNFFGTGPSGILWRNASGAVAAWQMNGASAVSTPVVGSAGNTWQIAGIGDFFHSGTSGILWRDTAGDLAIWGLSNGQVTTSQGLGTISNLWTLVE